MLSLFVSLALLSAADAGSASPIQFPVEKIQYVDAPNMPHGAQLAVLEGSPKEAGIFTLRLRVPPKFKLPLHTHPRDERVTVIDGSVFVQLEGKPAVKMAA